MTGYHKDYPADVAICLKRWGDCPGCPLESPDCILKEELGIVERRRHPRSSEKRPPNPRLVTLLKNLRKDRNLSQFRLSARAGFCQNWAQAVECGDRIPTEPELLQVAEVLEVDPWIFLSLLETQNNTKEQAA